MPLKSRILALLLGGAMAFLAFPAAALADGAPRLAVNRTSVPKARSTTVRLTLTEAHGGCLAVFVPATYRLDKAVTSPRGVVRPLVIRLKQGRWVVVGLNDLKIGKGHPQDDRLVLLVSVTGTVSGRSDWAAVTSDEADCIGKRVHATRLAMTITGAATKSKREGRAARAVGARTTQPSPKATKPAQPPSPNIDRSPPTDIGPDARTVRSTLDSPNRGLALTLNLGLDLAEWIVPGVVLTMPGLLLTIFIGAQVLGAAAWLPACRRYLGTFGVRRKPKRPA